MQQGASLVRPDVVIPAEKLSLERCRPLPTLCTTWSPENSRFLLLCGRRGRFLTPCERQPSQQSTARSPCRYVTVPPFHRKKPPLPALFGANTWHIRATSSEARPAPLIPIRAPSMPWQQKANSDLLRANKANHVRKGVSRPIRHLRAAPASYVCQRGAAANAPNQTHFECEGGHPWATGVPAPACSRVVCERTCVCVQSCEHCLGLTRSFLVLIGAKERDRQ
ncbi:hypothetical protein MRX96_019463 [Rhipicephalus microplus]